jgi:hypothetical protein
MVEWRHLQAALGGIRREIWSRPEAASVCKELKTNAEVLRFSTDPGSVRVGLLTTTTYRSLHVPQTMYTSILDPWACSRKGIGWRVGFVENAKTYQACIQSIKMEKKE